jgi:hypothetical protein
VTPSTVIGFTAGISGIGKCAGTLIEYGVGLYVVSSTFSFLQENVIAKKMKIDIVSSFFILLKVKHVCTI